MTLGDAAILIGGGLAAGVVNTLAGGGSLISVPLLVLVGLPGTVANGTNRVGVFLQRTPHAAANERMVVRSFIGCRVGAVRYVRLIQPGPICPVASQTVTTASMCVKRIILAADMR